VTDKRHRLFRPGPETWYKERDFRGLHGGIHLPICAGIRERYGRPGDPSYLFVDLHGGPGNLIYGNAEFPGSPLIALDELMASGLPYQTLHFERDSGTAENLAAAVAAHPGGQAATVISESFETGARQWLGLAPRHRFRNGLVYSDPISDPIPVDTFNAFAAHFERVDLLAYVIANDQYKRANGSGAGHGRRLADDIAAVHKKHVLIREPSTAHQFTFIFWTNWTEFPAWTRRGFHPLHSSAGRRILDRLNFTQRELGERDNTPLPFDPVPYRTYREYLRHPRFLKIRAQVFTRAAGLCERCGQRPPTEPHHLRYPPWGEFDVPENMIAVCHQCHCEIHGKAA
jgi:hypothetical protein